MNDYLKKIQLKLFKKYPKMMVKIYYKKIIGKKLNLNEPKLFPEKIQWLKFYYENDNKVLLSGDKVGLHKYLSNKNLSFLSVPLLASYADVEQIEWEKLPQKFVMKKSNSSGMNIIITNKSQVKKEKILQQMNEWMNEDFGVFGAELHYQNMDSKIVVEEFLEDITKDWRLYFINGVPEMLQVSHWDDQHEENYSGHRKSIVTFTDLKGKIKHVDKSSDEVNPNFKKDKYIDLPIDFDEMLKYGSIISKDFPLVRVDYFHSNGRLYIGELTFTPSGGFRKMSDEIQEDLGEKLVLPEWSIK